MTSLNVTYHGDGWLSTRFFDNAKFAMKRDIGNRDGDLAPNFLEKIGDNGLWFVEKLPTIVWEKAKDPRVVTLALTILALSTVSLAFYPATTILAFKGAVALLPSITAGAVKLSAYLLTCGTILSYAARAEGRFFNTALTNAFYGIRS